MPRRSDLRTILLVGAGPVAIGRGGELDHAVIDGCRALREEGFAVVLVSSNPASVTTAERTYIEPLTPAHLARIIERERPDAFLPTLGGRTGLSLALALSRDGSLARFGVELIGAPLAALRQAEDRELFVRALARAGLDPGPIPLEASVMGWRHVELEVLRDRAGRVVTVCSLEHVDPVGVHAGDSITVAPAQTLSEHASARMRDAALAVIDEIGVGAGNATFRLALSPRDGRLVVMEMSPWVTRSSALASAATGMSVARIVAKLAVGYTLDELPGDIAAEALTGGEPRLEHCVVKIPRWAFEHFPEADRTLTTQPKSVGEVMAIGRTFAEALQKAVRSLDGDARGLTLGRSVDARELTRLLERPTPERLSAIAEAYRRGWSTTDVHALTGIDRWFLDHIGAIVDAEGVIAGQALADPRVLRRAKAWGFADERIAELTGSTEPAIRALRLRHRITPAFNTVHARTAHASRYSTYHADADDAPPADRLNVVILGAGPSRIGQGMELDHCGAHAASALRALGVDAIVINCNPRAVTTDLDPAARLYVEPLTLEAVLDVVERERPQGVIVQFGGQTSLALAGPLERAGVPLLGTSADAIERAEDRERLGALLTELGLAQAPGATARSVSEAEVIAARLGYPLRIRGSSVLVRQAPRVVRDVEDLRRAAGHGLEPPIRIDKLLEDAIAVDVDAVSDGRRVLIGGTMEHIEKAGIHSGDAACVVPPYSLGPDQVEILHRQTAALARGLGVVGLLNVQFALTNDLVYVLGVHPRASRTVPFVSLAAGLPLAALATEVSLGRPLPTIERRPPGRVAVKEAVFPFGAFAGVDVVLGPETQSTGDVMGIDADVRQAYLKSQLAAGARLPTSGKVWMSVRPCDQRPLVMLAKRLGALGFSVVAAGDTARVLARHGVDVEVLPAGDVEPSRVLDGMRNGAIGLAIDIPDDGRSRARSAPARQEALRQNIPYYTTLDGAQAVIGAIEVLLESGPQIAALEDDDPAPAPLARAA